MRKRIKEKTKFNQHDINSVLMDDLHRVVLAVKDIAWGLDSIACFDQETRNGFADQMKAITRDMQGIADHITNAKHMSDL